MGLSTHRDSPIGTSRSRRSRGHQHRFSCARQPSKPHPRTKQTAFPAGRSVPGRGGPDGRGVRDQDKTGARACARLAHETVRPGRKSAGQLPLASGEGQVDGADAEPDGHPGTVLQRLITPAAPWTMNQGHQRRRQAWNRCSPSGEEAGGSAGIGHHPPLLGLLGPTGTVGSVARAAGALVGQPVAAVGPSDDRPRTGG